MLRPKLAMHALQHQENMSVKCIPSPTPPLYSKTGVCTGIPIFLIFAPKHRLWVLVRTASVRRGGSNVYPQSMFLAKIRKISNIFILICSILKLKNYMFIAWACFRYGLTHPWGTLPKQYLIKSERACSVHWRASNVRRTRSKRIQRTSNAHGTYSKRIYI